MAPPTFPLLAALALAAAIPAAAAATSFTLDYTTFDDGLHAPVTVAATLDASADPYVAGGYVIDAISGTRGADAITGLADPYSEIYYPAAVLPGYQFASFVDSFGLTFTAGGTDYQVYRGPGDADFYHEDANPGGLRTGRLIRPADFTLTPGAASVPEPGIWATMLAGFGAIGVASRRRLARA